MVTQEALEWLLGTQRAGLLRLPLAARALATKDWLTSETMSHSLARSGQSVQVPTFAVAPVHFFAFQRPCADLLLNATVDVGKAAEWAHSSARCYLMSPVITHRRQAFCLSANRPPSCCLASISRHLT